MLMNLLVKNIFENGTKVINIGKLVHDIKKVNLFLHKLRHHEEYKKNTTIITPYNNIVSENIHQLDKNKVEKHQAEKHQVEKHQVDNMKINDSIAIRKLQLNKSVKKSSKHTLIRPSMIPRTRYNRTQRINVIKI